MCWFAWRTGALLLSPWPCHLSAPGTLDVAEVGGGSQLSCGTEVYFDIFLYLGENPETLKVVYDRAGWCLPLCIAHPCLFWNVFHGGVREAVARPGSDQEVSVLVCPLTQ